MEGLDRRESLLIVASFFTMVIRQPAVGLGWAIRRRFGSHSGFYLQSKSERFILQIFIELL